MAGVAVTEAVELGDCFGCGDSSLSSSWHDVEVVTEGIGFFRKKEVMLDCPKLIFPKNPLSQLSRWSWIVASRIHCRSSIIDIFGAIPFCATSESELVVKSLCIDVLPPR
jgi:hypothetical protein